jgi:Fe-S-cluster containining protein
MGLTVRDIDAMARHLGITRQDFILVYCRVEIIQSWYAYTMALRPGCPFLQGNRCSVYVARPGACRRYPAMLPGMRVRDVVPVAPGCALYSMNPDEVLDADEREIDDNYHSMVETDRYLRLTYLPAIRWKVKGEG